MSDNRSYDNCEYFDIRNLCPYRDDEMMNGFIGDIAIISSVPSNLNYSREIEVNKICHACEKFKDNRSRK